MANRRAERVGIIEKVMNDGSIGSTFNEGMMKVEGETAYCVDINTSFKNGYKTRSDASSRMSSDQIADVALSLEYVKQYTASHTNLNYKQGYLLEQGVVWQRLSEQLGWQCDNVRASYNEISQAVQNEVYAGAKAFVKANKGRYECGGYIYTGEGQDIGQFWAKLNVGNAKVKKTSSNPTVTDDNANYSFEGATFGVYSDKGCNSQLATLTADGNGDTKEVEVKAGTVYIKELSAPKGYKLDSTVHALNVEVGKTATLTVADTPKVTETLIDLFKIDMETGKSTPQGTASLEGAEFTWSYYDGYYNADNLPAKATRTWTTKTVAKKDNDGTIHYVSRLADSYKVSGDSFYTQDSKNVLPLGTLTVTETKAPNGYLLDGAYMQADGSSEQIKGTYALGIMFRDFPDEIFAVRKDSPLIVGVGEHENFIASDVPAIIHYTRDYYLLDQNEIAVIKKDSVKIYDVHGNEIHKELNTADWDVDAAEKGGYAHFMLKEIHEQPDSVKRTIMPRIMDDMPDFSAEGFNPDKLKNYKNIYIVACGTAMHAGMVGKYIIEKIISFCASGTLPSFWILFPRPRPRNPPEPIAYSA